ncbi:MAG: ABC transporter ATP-binding protein [Nitrospinae bacterium]|nr:ABC transporter ATP-binding protein [Nitrospinota bacterium]
MLQIEGLSSGYGNNKVLDDVSLHVHEGEIVTIIGPNGAGKSTVFKSIVGFCRIMGGKIRFRGEEITRIRADKALQKGLAYVPQGRSVFPHMTVLENLEMGAFLERDAARLSAGLEKVFALFPLLKERHHQKAGTMSGGEQQMLAIGRGLMMNPDLVLLDEPSLGLAPKFVGFIFEKIAELRSMGTTLVIVEQNAAKALSIADRGYVLELGCNRFTDTGPGLLANEEARRLYLGG